MNLSTACTLETDGGLANGTPAKFGTFIHTRKLDLPGCFLFKTISLTEIKVYGVGFIF